AGTTLDTACRLQRYVVQELAESLLPASAASAPVQPSSFTLHPLRLLQNMHGATIFAVVVAAALAMMPASGVWSWETIGSGGMILWPLFGATNQLLGGLAFMVILFYLWRRGKPIWFIILP